MKKGLGIVLVLLGVAALSQAGIYWVGTRTEARMQAFAASHATVGAWNYSLVSYDRHFYDADAVSEISFTPPINPASPVQLQPVHFRLNHHIVHGSRLGHFDAASIVTTPVLGDDLAASLKPLFGDRAPLIWETDISFTGAQTGTVTSPAVIGPLAISGQPKPVTLDWGGIEGRYELSADGKTASLRLSQPKTTITGDMGVLHFEGIDASGAGKVSPDFADLWFGNFSFGIDEIHAEQGGQALADIGKLLFAADVNQAPAGVRMEEEVSMDSLTAAGTHLEKMDVKFSLGSLDGAALVELSKRIQDLQSKAPDPQQQMAQLQELFKDLAPKFLAKKPVFSIDKLAVLIDGQAVSGKAQVQYVGAGTLDQFNPMTDLDASLNFAAPAPLIKSLTAAVFVKQMAMVSQMSGRPVDAARLQDHATQQAEQSVQQLVDQKLLILENGQLRADASLHQGQVLVNGAPFSGMSPPAAQ